MINESKNQDSLLQDVSGLLCMDHVTWIRIKDTIIREHVLAQFPLFGDSLYLNRL